MERDTDSTQPRTTCPYMQLITLPNGEQIYCVYGLGMVFCHQQRWQAEWKLHAMCQATGCRR